MSRRVVPPAAAILISRSCRQIWFLLAIAPFGCRLPAQPTRDALLERIREPALPQRIDIEERSSKVRLDSPRASSADESDSSEPTVDRIAPPF